MFRIGHWTYTQWRSKGRDERVLPGERDGGEPEARNVEPGTVNIASRLSRFTNDISRIPCKESGQRSAILERRSGFSKVMVLPSMVSTPSSRKTPSRRMAVSTVIPAISATSSRLSVSPTRT